jgi:membrane protease subunit HflK
MNEAESNELKRPAGGAPEAPLPEDAGTQALSEALRSSFFIIQIIMVGLVLVFFGSGFFTVKEQNKAIILRLGRPVGKGEAALLGPGPHFAWPRPIDEVVLIPFKSSQRADSTVGWYLSAEDRARGAPDPQPQPSLDPATISYALTADTNIIHLAASARYRITDPIKFHFDFADAATFVTNDLNNALLYTASHFTVDDALSAQPTAFKEAVEARMRELVEKQDLGITVDGVDPQTSPPLTLLNDFHKVVQAISQGATEIIKANDHRTQVLGEARSEKEKRIKTADAARSRMVGLIGAEATNFSRLLADYERDPQLVQRLLQAETFKKVWANAQLTEVLPSLDGRQLRIHLSGPATPVVTSTNQPSP